MYGDLKLSCYGGNLTEIVEYISRENSHISTLTIKNCRPRIEKLEKLPAMTVRNLRMNNCGFKEVADDAFEKVSGIEELDLSNNMIIKMPYLRRLLKGLRELKLNQNKITDIPEDTFGEEKSGYTASSLRKLDLSNNLIESLPNLKYILERYEYLDLSYNKVIV
uniref:LRRcap domain-containing protein n=1 Tax=Panagrellus redivivus TaxID=6233 RepID=A0A7E4VQB6_PANRE